MKKAYSVLCVFLALFLVAALWGIHYLRNNHRDTLSPIPLPPSDKVFAVDINTAGIDELCCLPGIGEVLARRIIDFRNEHGEFTHISQIQNVKGIGEETFKEIEPYLVIGV